MCAILTGIKSVMRVLARARLIAHIKSSKLGNLPKQFLKALFIPFCETDRVQRDFLNIYHRARSSK